MRPVYMELSDGGQGVYINPDSIDVITTSGLDDTFLQVGGVNYRVKASLATIMQIIGNDLPDEDERPTRTGQTNLKTGETLR